MKRLLIWNDRTQSIATLNECLSTWHFTIRHGWEMSSWCYGNASPKWWAKIVKTIWENDLSRSYKLLLSAKAKLIEWNVRTEYLCRSRKCAVRNYPWILYLIKSCEIAFIAIGCNKSNWFRSRCDRRYVSNDYYLNNSNVNWCRVSWEFLCPEECMPKLIRLA